MQRYRTTEIVAPPGQGPPVRSLVEDRSSGPRRLDGPLLRPEQAAELLAVKPSWVYDAVRTGRLPCLRGDATSASRRPCSKTGSPTISALSARKKESRWCEPRCGATRKR
jgi:hypothetical protein